MSIDQKEIGGYFELECPSGMGKVHKGVYLNSGRNALRCILRAYNIDHVFVPTYTCPVVWEAIQDEGIKIDFYDIDALTFLPVHDLPSKAYIIYNNYFGVNGKNVKRMAEQYPNLLIDNAQAFYAKPCGMASFYSPRKFCGLPDGGIACCEKTIEIPDARDSSMDRMEHLLGRLDANSASAYYGAFKKSDETLKHLPVKKMSYLCEALLGNIDFDYIKKRRLANFSVLHAALNSRLVRFMDEVDVPMAYPFYAENKLLRKNLIENKIYVAAYWPGLNERNNFKDRILALPLDQRYGTADMMRIVKCIQSFL